MGGGQVEGELAEFAGFTVDADAAAVAADDAETDAQAEAGALANVLGGEKRVKDFRNIFWLDARSVVPDENQGAAVFAATGDADDRRRGRGDGRGRGGASAVERELVTAG